MDETAIVYCGWRGRRLTLRVDSVFRAQIIAIIYMEHIRIVRSLICASTQGVTHGVIFFLSALRERKRGGEREILG